MKKSLLEITGTDLEHYPVWEVMEGRNGNIDASPVRNIPVQSLQNRFVGCQVTLHNGQKYWAELFNIDLNNARATLQFLTLSILVEGRRFHLARYFDVDFSKRGPAVLSQFLALKVQEIFPIFYDISHCVMGASIPTSGLIYEAPHEKLSQDELMRLSLE